MILTNSIDMPKRKRQRKYIPKEGEKRFVLRLPDEDYATLELLSQIEDASFNGTIISLIRREMLRKKQA